MKKLTILLLILVLVLSACASGEEVREAGDLLYYYPGGTTFGEEQSLLSAPGELPEDPEDLEGFLEAYLASQPPEGAQHPVSPQWKLQTVRREEQTALLTFSGTGGTALDRSLSCACLAKTLLQLPGIRQVSVKTPGRETPVVLTGGDILLEDKGMLPQEETVTLYYPDEAGRYLQRRTVTVDAQYAGDKARFILEQLLGGEEAASAIPRGTKLLGLRQENGICSVNLSAAFLQAGQTFAGERLAVYSIVNSLTELTEIRRVDFLTSGTPVETLGLMDLSSGVVRDESLIAASGKNMVDVTLYPVCSGEGLLAAVPVMLEVEEGQSVAEATAAALLSYESRNGMEGCVPVGTKLLKLRMENTTCILELTGEFLTGCPTVKAETLAVRSVIATMCGLPEISSVEILVEGISPAYGNGELANLHQPSQAWVTE